MTANPAPAPASAAPRQPSYPGRPAVVTFLGLLLALGVVRLGGFVHWLRTASLQMDFSAFYTAGEAANHGVSPYLTNIALRIWDGVDGYFHSRFLYPPLVATLFRPIAALPYGTAKVVWMILALVALGVAIMALLEYVPPSWRLETGLLAGCAAVYFYPLLTLLERGQMDTCTMVLLAIGFRYIRRDGHRSRIGGGLAFAGATLLKLNCGFIFPFLLLRGKWRAAAGFAAGGLILLGASAAINGPRAVADYIHTEMPRIERCGEGCGARLSSAEVRSLSNGAPSGRTSKGGRFYPDAAFGFTANATAVRLRIAARWFGRRARTPSALALRLLEVSLVPMGLLEVVLRFRRVTPTDAENLCYWTGVAMILLLTGPFTWVMNTVWLCFVPVAFCAAAARLRHPWQGAWLGVAAVGFLWAAAPEPGAFHFLNPFTRRWISELVNQQRYIVAELSVLVGMIGVLACSPGGRAAPPEGVQPAAVAAGRPAPGPPPPR